MSQLGNISILEWSQLAPRYEALLQEPLGDSQLEKFLHDWSKLQEDVDETENLLRLRVDLNTADDNAAAALRRFNDQTLPRVTEQNAALRAKALAAPRKDLRPGIAIVLRRMQTDQDVYRPENVPLESEHANLVLEYSRISGRMEVDTPEGKITVPAAVDRLRLPERRAREAIWHAWQTTRLAVAPTLDELFLKLHAIRQQMARNSQLDNYRSLIWHQYHRYDYTPEDCYAFHQSIETEVVPFATELLEEHRAALQVPTLKPWDFYWRAPVDPLQRPPLQPFQDVSDLITGMQRVFSRLDPELGTQFAAMQEGWMDLESRPNKMAHAYCTAFPKRQMPFVLQNVVGSAHDIATALHEFGHAFHGYASMRSQPLVWNHFSATEFVEVPSQAMEVLALPLLHRDRGGFYAEDELQRVTQIQIATIVHLLTWIGFMDAMQHWMYAEVGPGQLTIADIDAKAVETLRRFMPQTDWSGCEREQRKVWQYHHIFTAPFYYIEYGIAWLGALQIWRNSLQDRDRTVGQYRAALALGNSRPVPELFEAAGAKFAFDRETLRELVGFLREQRTSPTASGVL